MPQLESIDNNHHIHIHNFFFNRISVYFIDDVNMIIIMNDTASAMNEDKSLRQQRRQQPNHLSLLAV